MFTTLMIVSLDQGKLKGAPRRIGQFDARLLEDIGYAGNGFPTGAAPTARRTPRGFDHIISWLAVPFFRPAGA